MTGLILAGLLMAAACKEEPEPSGPPRPVEDDRAKVILPLATGNTWTYEINTSSYKLVPRQQAAVGTYPDSTVPGPTVQQNITYTVLAPIIIDQQLFYKVQTVLDGGSPAYTYWSNEKGTVLVVQDSDITWTVPGQAGTLSSGLQLYHHGFDFNRSQAWDAGNNPYTWNHGLPYYSRYVYARLSTGSASVFSSYTQYFGVDTGFTPRSEAYSESLKWPNLAATREISQKNMQTNLVSFKLF